MCDGFLPLPVLVKKRKIEMEKWKTILVEDVALHIHKYIKCIYYNNRHVYVVIAFVADVQIKNSLYVFRIVKNLAEFYLSLYFSLRPLILLFFFQLEF